MNDLLKPSFAVAFLMLLGAALLTRRASAVLAELF